MFDFLPDPDAPRFTLHLSTSEAYALRDALACFGYAGDGHADIVDTYRVPEDGSDGGYGRAVHETAERIYDRLRGQMDPQTREFGRMVRALARERDRRRQSEN